ncbi:MAG: hypothetical protein JSR54_14780 [Proteobacteria bacterium]|nr:hypothetical protein [Pseudomonadota bacterium]
MTESALPAPASFSVPPDHPSLPGHFPGAPVVPGVVVLDHVLALAHASPERARRLAWVKFLRPLLPAERAEVAFARVGAELRFSVTRAGEALVRGALLDADGGG